MILTFLDSAIGPWVLDGTAIAAISTAIGGVLSAIIVNLANRKDKANEYRDKKMEGGLNELGDMIQGVQDTISNIATNTDLIKDGTKKTQRYRLFHDLKAELMQGYTTLEKYRELSILFESYKALGGNGEIEKLFDKYELLPTKEEE